MIEHTTGLKSRRVKCKSEFHKVPVCLNAKCSSKGKRPHLSKYDISNKVTNAALMEETQRPKQRDYRNKKTGQKDKGHRKGVRRDQFIHV